MARALCHRNARLLLVARRESRLQTLADDIREQNGEVFFVAGDITRPETRTAVVDLIGREWGGLDALINNAGIGGVGAFQQAEPDRLRRMLEVNVVAPAELTREVLPWLEAGTNPIVVNVGSVLGHVAVPWKSEYCASKFALRGFSDSLRAEFARQGVDLLHVDPSTTKTEFFEKASQDGEQKKLTNWNSVSPENVAGQILQAMVKGRHEVILTVSGKLVVTAHRLLPGITRWLIRKFLPQPH
jgi:short-subunit dehydrogenase